MDHKELEALEQAICKYDLICQGVGVNYGSANCSLCLRQYVLKQEGCGDCVIKRSTGKESCADTPYYAFVAATAYKGHYDYAFCDLFPILVYDFRYNPGAAEDHINLILARAEDELVFLLSLLPEGHPWEEQI